MTCAYTETSFQGVAVVPYILHAQMVSAGEISDLPDKYPLMLRMLKAGLFLHRSIIGEVQKDRPIVKHNW